MIRDEDEDYGDDEGKENAAYDHYEVLSLLLPLCLSLSHIV